ncbi:MULTISPECIES: tyrosine-type recombinase/integrase [Rhodococcus]|uniref:tyrosine-type recombinase/integrase n=1 Tax=Rhodococcus TaxID=1827 RepID=UPI000693F2A1|nr:MULTISPECIES: site-specific integrase [Rhodococcus]MDV8129321.1 site-specific integrase [Rhodococcus sp. IEGM 1304]
MTSASGQRIWTPTVDAPLAITESANPTGAQLLASFPPRPVAVSWSATEPSRSEVLGRVLSAPLALDNPNSQQTRRLGILAVLSWLQTQSGDSWQQRWRASNAEEQRDWRDLVRPDTLRAKPLPHLSPGLLVLICADVIRPSQEWLLRFAPARRNLATEMARTRDPGAFAALAQLCTDGGVGLQSGQQALTRIAVIMAAKGGSVDAVRVGDCVELLGIAARMRATSEAYAHSPLFYQLLRAHGVLSEDAPAAIEMFSGRGQPSCEQLIDRYRIACRPVRDVLVDYLRERQLSVDFSSLQRLAYLLGKLFWADLQAHHPGIDSLTLPRDVAAAWKQRALTRTRTTHDGERVDVASARLDGRSVLTAVRAFYLDIAEWADDDPARWGPWAVRCPVSASDASHKKDRSQRKSRMDARTRERLPVLPALVSWVAAERTGAAELLAAAERARPGELFTAAGATLRRSQMKTETTGRIWAEDPESGPRRDLSFEEHRGFWTWAVVEVLRHTGIRIEELTELSHHSLIQYRLPATGELIPLLQITPSKTDTERLLVISPELADVLSAIIARIRLGQPHVPLVVSYDKNERVYNPPMPLLFQWHRRLENRAVSERALRQYLDHALTAIGVKDASNRPLRYTFHDFRRLFITDAITHGMPPHIAQLVAGHRDINTTIGYKAVYPEEVINGHRAFIARRRALRPSEEYRTPTDEEWAQFVGHFEQRKVAVGDCGRSYDTPCIHEHSCLRCPLLRPDPAARPRLEQIRDNLLARIAEAESHRWFGEAEGLKVSLVGARAKLAEMDQIAARRNSAVTLGIPSFADSAGRTITTPLSHQPHH